MIDIRKPEPNDFAAWSKLMQEYFEFYKFPVTLQHLEQVFSKIIQDKSIYSLLAFNETEAVGVANYMFNHSTFNLTECYLSDLYVFPHARGHSIATRLIDAVKHDAKQHGYTSIYWLTATSNLPAQRVYDKIANKGSWLIYTSEIE